MGKRMTAVRRSFCFCADAAAEIMDSIIQEIRTTLFSLRDGKYGEFQRKLIPSIDPEMIIGVRTPALRTLAKELGKRPDTGIFLGEVPHRYFEENQLHAFIISGIKDYESCMDEVERFLPYIDNWATCDQMSPGVFKKNKGDLLDHIKKWIASEETYTVRFGAGMLMAHYLDGDFDPSFPELVLGIRSEEYYVNMMRAWYFATALAKQYEAVLPLIEEQRLDAWTHNKAIQKSIESRRITAEQKQYLRSLKI